MFDAQGNEMNPGGPEIQIGAPIYAANGDKVGEVSEQGFQNGMLVMRKGLLFPKDVQIPLSAIRSGGPDGVHLNIAKEQIQQLAERDDGSHGSDTASH